MVSELEIEKIKKTDVMSVGMLNGADEENRTPVSTMARSCSTIELHLHDGGPNGTRTRNPLRDREVR